MPSPSAAASQTARKRKLDWTEDGVDNGYSSMDCLIAWMGTGSNYKSFKGGMNGGHTKMDMADKAAKWMNAHGCPVQREAKEVYKKVG